MANPENNLDVYYAVGNANTKIQENEIGLIIKSVNLLDGDQSQRELQQ